MTDRLSAADPAGRNVRDVLAWWPWVRRLRDIDGKAQARWAWTPITYRFGHGGWIYLDVQWLWRFRKGA